MKHFSHLNTAISILGAYKGESPFHHFLKSFFASRKKYGSRDRKQIAQICYRWFRTGLLFDEASAGNIAKAYFLCSETADEFLQAIAPELNNHASASPKEKCRLLGIEKPVVFPEGIALSEGIDRPLFEASHLLQPRVFLRIRPGQQATVINQLEKAGLPFESIGESTLSVSAAARIEDILAINKDAVIQDLSSQQTGELFRKLAPAGNAPLQLWDCCAASGGKSIMAFDRLGNPGLTITDIRESILANLRTRFAEAGIRNFRARIADLTSPTDPFPGETFNLVMADVPCTGSGTWGRTPEQMRYFDTATLASYTSRQTSIALNAAKKISDKGYMLYITCSVFREENEAIVDQLVNQAGLTLLEKNSYPGYTQRADSMFAALLQKG